MKLRTKWKLSAGVLLCGPIFLSLGLVSSSPLLSWAWSRKTQSGTCWGILALRRQDKMERKTLLSVFWIQRQEESCVCRIFIFWKSLKFSRKKKVWLKDQSTGKWIWIRAHPYPVESLSDGFLFSLDWPKSLFGFSRFTEKPEQTFWPRQCICGPSQVVLVVKNPLANANDAWDAGSIPGSGRCSGEGNSNHFNILAWRSPWTRGAWWATVHQDLDMMQYIYKVEMKTDLKGDSIPYYIYIFLFVCFIVKGQIARSWESWNQNFEFLALQPLVLFQEML